MNFSTVNNHFEIAKKSLAIALGLTLSAAIVFKGDAVLDTVNKISERLKSAEVAGVKLEFNEAVIQKSVRPDLFQHLDARARRAIVADITAFRPRTVVRLLSVGLLDKTCDYSTPTHDMAQDYAADIFLREKKLVTLDPADAEKDDILRKIKQRESQTGKKSDIGYPQSCYKITLTDHGMDVRTALVHVFGSTFAANGDVETVSLKKMREAQR